MTNVAHTSDFIYPRRGYRPRALVRLRRNMILGEARAPAVGLRACVEALDAFVPLVAGDAFRPPIAADAFALRDAVGGVFVAGHDAADVFVPQSPSQGNCGHA